jgi:NDP-sugar pyrophosphorylase family protein
VRRALLKGARLDSPVDGATLHRDFTSVAAGASRAEVLDLMQSRRINQIPILDAAGRMVGLHTLHEILGAVARPNLAVVMAGGLGERLRPLTDTIPKPMIKVAGRPILERIVLHLVGFGIRRIFLAVNYKADVIEAHFGDGARFGCRIEYLKERKPLGTGGALSLLPESPADPFLVLNGDLLTQFNLARMLAFHEGGGYRATIGTHEYAHTIPYGVVEVEEDRVAALREKPSQVWQTGAGIYVFEPELAARVPPDTFYPLPGLLEECLDGESASGHFVSRRTGSTWGATTS